MNAVAIIPAAGYGTRLQQFARSRSKVLLPLSGDGPDAVSALELVLRQLVVAGCFSAVVLSVREEDRSEVELLLRKVASELRTTAVLGGETRQQSVYHALCAVEGWGEVVAVHDGARPFCRPELIREVVCKAEVSGGAIVALPVTSTIKEGTIEHGVVGTISRERKWLAQTPQAFRYSLLREAMEEAIAEGVDVTDEAGLLERRGARVEIVPGDPMNIKITTPEDLLLARRIAPIFLG